MKSMIYDLITFAVLLVFYIGGFVKNLEVYGFSHFFTVAFGVGCLVLSVLVIISAIDLVKSRQ